MGGLLGGGGGEDKPKPPPPPKIEPLPAPPDPLKEQGKADEALRKKKAGQTKSVYTDPLGVKGQAQVVRKTLTGQ